MSDPVKNVRSFAARRNALAQLHTEQVGRSHKGFRGTCQLFFDLGNAEQIVVTAAESTASTDKACKTKLALAALQHPVFKINPEVVVRWLQSKAHPSSSSSSSSAGTASGSSSQSPASSVDQSSPAPPLSSVPPAVSSPAPLPPSPPPAVAVSPPPTQMLPGAAWFSTIHVRVSAAASAFCSPSMTSAFAGVSSSSSSSPSVASHSAAPGSAGASKQPIDRTALEAQLLAFIASPAPTTQFVLTGHKVCLIVLFLLFIWCGFAMF